VKIIGVADKPPGSKSIHVAATEDEDYPIGASIANLTGIQYLSTLLVLKVCHRLILLGLLATGHGRNNSLDPFDTEHFKMDRFAVAGHEKKGEPADGSSRPSLPSRSESA
jgi:hypothetical protein